MCTSFLHAAGVAFLTLAGTLPLAAETPSAIPYVENGTPEQTMDVSWPSGHPVAASVTA
jgi:hypothetical protein